MSLVKRSILAIASDCPNIDYRMLECVCRSYDAARNYVAKLVKSGFLQKDEHRSTDDGTARFSITKKGLLELYALQSKLVRKDIDLSERPADGFFTKDVTIPMNNGSFTSGGNSHFKTMELTHLWMQLRCQGGRKRAILWDYVDEPKRYGLSGNPDIILHDGYDIKTQEFRRPIFVELETAYKSDEKVKQKITELLTNEFHYLLFVGHDLAILRKISIGMRHFIPTSNFYANKGGFSRPMYEKNAHLLRIWFLHWDATIKPMKANDLRSQILKRADHPDFDHYEYERDGYGKNHRTRIIKDRWADGPNEITLDYALNYISKAERANGMK